MTEHNGSRGRSFGSRRGANEMGTRRGSHSDRGSHQREFYRASDESKTGSNFVEGSSSNYVNTTGQNRSRPPSSSDQLPYKPSGDHRPRGNARRGTFSGNRERRVTQTKEDENKAIGTGSTVEEGVPSSNPLGSQKKKRKNHGKKKRSEAIDVKRNNDHAKDLKSEQLPTLILPEADVVEESSLVTDEILHSFALLPLSVTANVVCVTSRIESDVQEMDPVIDHEICQRRSVCVDNAMIELKVPAVSTSYSALKCNAWLRSAVGLVDPVDRWNLGHKHITTIKEFLDLISSYSCVSIDVESFKDFVSPNPTSQSKLDKLLQNLLKVTRRTFAIWAASVGFVAHDYVESYDALILDIYSEMDIEANVSVLLEFARLLASVDKVVQMDTWKTLAEFDKISMLKGVIDKNADQIQILEQYNVTSKIDTPADRLRFGLHVPDDVVHKMLVDSLNGDFGTFVWLSQNAASRLHTLENIMSILGKTTAIAKGTDARRWIALYKAVPAAIAALSPDDREVLAEKFANNEETWVKKWITLIDNGFSSKKTRGALIENMVAAESKEQLAPFLMFLFLIAPFESDTGNEGLLSNLVRLLICDAHQTPIEKRNMLLESLLTLPSPIRDRLLAVDPWPLSTSLYGAVDILLTEVKDTTTFKEKGCDGIIIMLTKYISPMRLMSGVIMPKMSTTHRGKAALAMQTVFLLDEFKAEVSVAGAAVSLAQLLKLALDQYEEPDLSIGASVPPRYPFMEKAFRFVDSVLSSDEIEDSIITEIEKCFESRALQWYQYIVICRSFFCNSLHKFKLSAGKISDTDLTYDEFRKLHVTSILRVWPENVPQTLLSSVVKDEFTHIDPLIVICSLLDELYSGKTNMKSQNAVLNVVNNLYDMFKNKSKAEKPCDSDLNEAVEALQPSVIENEIPNEEKPCDSDPKEAVETLQPSVIANDDGGLNTDQEVDENFLVVDWIVNVFSNDKCDLKFKDIIFHMASESRDSDIRHTAGTLGHQKQ